VGKRISPVPPRLNERWGRAEERSTWLRDNNNSTIGLPNASDSGEPKNAIGQCPVTDVLLWGHVKVRSLLDTGSMVSIVTRDFFENYVQPRGWELKKDISLKLTAANGLSLPYDGYFISDVTIFGTSVKDRVFLVLKEELKRPSEPCIIGMNILQEISPWSEILNTDSSSSSLPQRTQPPPVGKYVRVARDSCIPPSTVLAVSVTGPHPSAAGQFIVEPLPVLIKGAVFAVPVRVEACAGRLTTLLVNAGDTATVLRRNTVVGLLSKEDPCLNLAATSYGIDVTLSDTADIGGCPAPPSQAMEAMIAGCVTGSHRVDLRHLLAEHNDLFAWSEMDLGYTDKVHHRIPVTTDVPVSQPYRRLPPKQFEESDGRRVIAYASRSLRPNERNMRNYSSFKLELLGLKWAVTEKFRGYLLGSKCEVMTDNNPLSHLQTAKLGAVEQRWAAELALFDLDIKYRPGKQNANADSLSRYPVESPVGGGETDTDCCMVGTSAAPGLTAPTTLIPAEVGVIGYCESSTALPHTLVATEVGNTSSLGLDNIKESQLEDPDIAIVIGHVRTGQKPKGDGPTHLSSTSKLLLRQWPRLTLDDGCLVRRCTPAGTVPLQQVVIPSSLVPQVLMLAHDQNGHQGAERTLQFLRRRCYWPRMTSDTQDYCASCNRCQVAKTPPVKFSQTTGHLISTAPLELVAIDFTKLERASDGREDVLVCTDVFTKWTIAAPTRDQTARTVARVLLREWIPHYGVPLRLHSDQGRSFDAEIVRCLCEHYGIQRSRTTPYNPQGVYSSAQEYLSLHVKRLRQIHELALARIKSAAKQREKPHVTTAYRPEIGDKVLLRQHPWDATRFRTSLASRLTS
ncbi:hypothetical protein RRG08_033337, partial [Elysia crispata]